MPLVIEIKPEKTGNVEASTVLGRVNRAVTSLVWPRRRVKVVWLKDTEAASAVKGTGPSAGKMVPCQEVSQVIGINSSTGILTGCTVMAVPAGMCLRVYCLVVSPVFLTENDCLRSIRLHCAISEGDMNLPAPKVCGVVENKLTRRHNGFGIYGIEDINQSSALLCNGLQRLPISVT